MKWDYLPVTSGPVVPGGWLYQVANDTEFETSDPDRVTWREPIYVPSATPTPVRPLKPGIGIPR